MFTTPFMKKRRHYKYRRYARDVKMTIIHRQLPAFVQKLVARLEDLSGYVYAAS